MMIQQMKEKIPIVKSVIPVNNGIFSHMNYDFKYITKSQLDLLFFTEYGHKRVAPLLSMYINDGIISDEKMNELANIILSYYKYNWDKLIAMLEIEYDPIHNFSDELSEEIKDTDDKNISNDETINQTGDGTKTRTDNLTSTDTKDIHEGTTGNVEDRFAGLNSTTYVNKDKEESSQDVHTTGTDTVVDTGTQSTKDERNYQTTSNGKEVINDNYTRDRKVSRVGNIGNITTQQMLTQEIELWKWNFVNTILENVKYLITLSVYF